MPSWKSNLNPMFRSQFSESIFNHKYRHEGAETWEELCTTLTNEVCSGLMPPSEIDQLRQYMVEMKFIPGGRYLYYAGRPNPFYNNCYLLRAEEDTREDWANLSWKAESCLMTGGGIGIDYSVYRPSGAPIARTGGHASGPLPKMEMINEIGRRVMQGGSRRSAIYASLNWQHPDAEAFLTIKDWENYPVPLTDGLTLKDLKQQDFNWPCPLDMTNISLNYDDAWLNTPERHKHPTFLKNVRQALKSAEPGFSFNFGDKERETLRNAPVHPDTWVMLSTGYEQIKNIVDAPVTVWTGKRWAPTRFTKTRTNSDTVKVVMTGSRELICSPDHEFILSDGSRKQAQYLAPNDHVMWSPPKASWGKNVPEAYALAFVYGDGSFHTRYPRAEAALCGTKETILDRLTASGIAHEVSRDKRNILRVYFNNHDIFRSRRKDSFPLDVYSWNRNSQLEFLAGLLDADGCFSAKSLVLSSIQREFLEGVARLCDMLGFTAFINKGSKSGFSPDSAGGYTLRIKGKISEIPTSRLVLEDTNFGNYKVVSVEEYEKSDVYCCDVGFEEHSFMANGVIISNCTEVTSADGNDVCNLGSLNLGRIKDLSEMRSITELATKFLVCGTLKAKLPYQAVYEIREKNRRLGLGLMGVHEWLIKKGYRYEVTPELRNWLAVYQQVSDYTSATFADSLGISRPVANRAIAPTGTIGILAGTTTGIEPLFAVAYKRRYLKGDKDWHYQYVVDGTAKELIEFYGADPEKIESAIDLAQDFERRIAFQADIQDYVDMAISSTINLPQWGSEYNNEETVGKFAETLSKYAPRLRGFTAYPDGARGGQPLTPCSYKEANALQGQEFPEGACAEYHDICDISGKGGSCGV